MQVRMNAALNYGAKQTSRADLLARLGRVEAESVASLPRQLNLHALEQSRTAQTDTSAYLQPTLSATSKQISWACVRRSARLSGS